MHLHHVESHVDKKKDKDGNLRIPTSIQRMNIVVDKLADFAYDDTSLHPLHTKALPAEERCVLYLDDKPLTGIKPLLFRASRNPAPGGGWRRAVMMRGMVVVLFRALTLPQARNFIPRQNPRQPLFRVPQNYFLLCAD